MAGMSWHRGVTHVAAACACAWALAGTAAAAPGVRLRGLTLPEALQRLEQQGLRILYSSELVNDTMRVRREPAGADPASILAEIADSHGLAVETGPGGMLVLVRDPQAGANRGRIVGLLRRLSDGAPLAGALVTLPAQERRALTDERGRFEFRAVAAGEHELRVQDRALPAPLQATVRVRAGRTSTLRLDAAEGIGPDLAVVIVTASRYAIGREPVPSLMALSGPDLEQIPDIGEDPLRALARLPGLTGSDFSAKLNVRGGAGDEVLFRFDGLRLVNPFHMKDFLSPFSGLNPGFVGDIDVYAGGFPVNFGDRMSAVVDVAPAPRPEAPVREIAVSVFNSAVLVAGPYAQGDWLVAARRGHLDLIARALKPELGRPRYRDFHARVRREFGGTLDVTANVLLLDDDIRVRDGDAEEQARARYRDTYGWLRLKYQPDAGLQGDTVLAWSNLHSRRSGTALQPGIGSGELSDRHHFDIVSLQTDWTWRPGDAALLKFGGEWRHGRGRYDYHDRAEFELLLDHPGAADELERERSVSLRRSVDYLGAYSALRLDGPGNLTSETGLRVDAGNGSAGRSTRLSPRLALRYPVGDRLQLRASWGRFVQTQGIEEIAVSDGETGFARPQRADHVIAGIEYRAPRGFDVRIEGYGKRYRHPRARHENLLNTFVLLPELKPDRVRIAPIRARARGLELSLRRSEPAHFDWWLSYQYALARDEMGGARTRRAWDQRHRVSAGLVWQTEAWEASIAGVHHSGWPTTTLSLRPDSDPAVVDAGPVNATRLKEYASLDARIARKFRMAGNDQLTLFVEVTNLLNRKNQCCVDFDLDDEAALPTLDAALVKGRSIVPSAGFVWRF